jgi:hypothetical protein
MSTYGNLGFEIIKSEESQSQSYRDYLKICNKLHGHFCGSKSISL